MKWGNPCTFHTFILWNGKVGVGILRPEKNPDIEECLWWFKFFDGVREPFSVGPTTDRNKAMDAAEKVLTYRKDT